MNDITLPYNFTPRSYQLPLLRALDSGGYKRAVAVWHRRAGKDLVMLNFIAKKMYERVGTYYYFFPTYRQAKKVIWNGMTRDGVKFTDAFPQELRKRTDNGEMLIEMDNGSIFQLIGTDNIDAVMGSNPVGCVFSEWSLQNPQAWDYVRPILAENGGWSVFIYTPRGKNHGYTSLETARAFPDTWYSEVLTVEGTKAIDPDVLNQEYDEIVRKDGNDALYQQEYMCNFDVPIQGAYYATQLLLAESEGRITSVPYDSNTPVHTAWDLGMDDSMSIWFFQVVNQEIHFIDYYESSGEGINYYIKYLQDKGYIYGRHFAPHDIAVRELGTGKSRYEVAKSLGITFEIGKALAIEDGIQAVRNVLGRCWFDKDKTDRGLSALRSYHKEWDEDNQVYKQRPEHDWSSHGSDAFRTFAVGYRELVTLPPATHTLIRDDPYQRPHGGDMLEGGNIVSDFKPYKPDELYKVVLSKDQVMLVQKMRDMKYGSLVIHFVGGKPVRTETTNSEMTNEAKDSKVTIEFEVIEEQVNKGIILLWKYQCTIIESFSFIGIIHIMQKLKHKKVKGRMKVLKVVPYMGHMVYIRQIGKDYFEYLLEYNNQIYSSYIIILPEEGKKKLTKSQINGCIEMVYAGAEATINALMGIEPLEDEKNKVEMFEKAVKETEKVKNGKK